MQNFDELNGWIVPPVDEYIKTITECKQKYQDEIKKYIPPVNDQQENDNNEPIKTTVKNSGSKSRTNISDLSRFIDSSLSELQSIKSDLKSIQLKKGFLSKLLFAKHNIKIEGKNIPKTARVELTRYMRPMINTAIKHGLSPDYFTLTQSIDLLTSYFKFLKSKFKILTKQGLPVLNKQDMTNMDFTELNGIDIENHTLDVLENCENRLKAIINNASNFDFLNDSYLVGLVNLTSSIAKGLYDLRLEGIEQIRKGKQFSDLTAKLKLCNFGILDKMDSLTKKLQDSHREYRKKKENSFMNLFLDKSCGGPKNKLDYLLNLEPYESNDESKKKKKKERLKKHKENYDKFNQKISKDSKSDDLSKSLSMLNESKDIKDLNKSVSKLKDTVKQLVDKDIMSTEKTLKSNKPTVRQLQILLCDQFNLDEVELLGNAEDQKYYLDRTINGDHKKHIIAEAVIELDKIKKKEPEKETEKDKENDK